MGSCPPVPQGCFKHILKDLRKHADIVGGVAAGIGVLEVKALGPEGSDGLTEGRVSQAASHQNHEERRLSDVRQ